MIKNGSLQSYDFNFNNTDTGNRLRGIEVAFNFSRYLGTSFTPPSSGEYSLRVVTFGGNTVDTADACGGGQCTGVVNLVVEGYKIKASYYVVGGQRYPVPVPEPGVLVSAAAVVAALGAIAFAARRIF